MDIAGPIAIGAATTVVATGIGSAKPPLRDAARAVCVLIVTAAWDVVLRLLATGQAALMGAENWGWVRDLSGYFESVGTWHAAAAAGAVGVMGYSVIRLYTPRTWAGYTAWVFGVSAVVGIPMRYGKWFEELQRDYYNQRPLLTAATDGLSGVIVALTVVAIGALSRAAM